MAARRAAESEPARAARSARRALERAASAADIARALRQMAGHLGPTLSARSRGTLDELLSACDETTFAPDPDARRARDASGELKPRALELADGMLADAAPGGRA